MTVKTLPYASSSTPPRATESSGFVWTRYLTLAVISSFFGIAGLVGAFLDDDLLWWFVYTFAALPILVAQAIFAAAFTMNLLARSPIGRAELLAILGVWLLGPVAIAVGFGHVWHWI